MQLLLPLQVRRAAAAAVSAAESQKRRRPGREAQSRERLQIEDANLHTSSHYPPLLAPLLVLINSSKFAWARTRARAANKVNNVWQLSRLNDLAVAAAAAQAQGYTLPDCCC